MAKKTHQYSLKGNYDHERQIIAEYDKKTEETSRYSLVDLLKEFDGKEISITVKEEDFVATVDESEEE